MDGGTWLRLLVSIALLGPGSATAPPAAVSRAPAGVMFGFELGELRRYEFGPRELLPGGEFIEWGIRLAAIEGSEHARRATFALEFRKGELRPAGPNHIDLVPDAPPVRITSGEGTLLVNASGFPLQMRSRVSMRSIARHTRARWVNGSFLIENPDTTGLRKYFVRYRRLESVPDRQVDGVFVGGRDVWGNPGLRAIPAHELVANRETSRRSYAKLDPGGATIGVRDRGWMRAETRRSRHLLHQQMTLSERDRVEVGNRTFDAWKIRMEGTDVWVDERGRVLRVGGGPRHSRLLLPHEY